MVCLSLRQSLRLSQRIELVQAQIHYVTSGDLELLSLHKIKNRIGSLDIHPEVRQTLVGNLVRENQEYKRDSGKDWNCITPNSLDNAVYSTVEYLREQLNLGISTIDDLRIKQATKLVLNREIEAQNTKIKQWFFDNYDNIIYQMNGNIPYPIVMQMRDSLGKWVLGNVNPFQEPIKSLIERIARSVGINPDFYSSYEDVWEALKG